MWKWLYRLKRWKGEVESFLRADYLAAGRLFIHQSPTPCIFCEKQSLFCLRGVNKEEKVQHLHCCKGCKREIEVGSAWIVNNLAMAHGLTRWSIQRLDN